MTDEVDQAQVAEALFLRGALDRRRAAVPAEPRFTELLCRACGEDIPAARRAAVPACRFCVDCQDTLEART